MRRLTAVILPFVLTVSTAIPEGGQPGDEELAFPDGEWVGRFQTLTTTPTGFSRTVVEFTVETRGGAGVNGDVTGYAATGENRETNDEFDTLARSTVIDHDFGLDVDVAPPTFSGTATWRWELVTESRVGVQETELPDETLPATWPMPARAVSCTAVSARGGGGDANQRFRTEMVALRQGGSDVVEGFVALLDVIEERLAAGDVEPLEATELLRNLAGLIRAHNDELAALAECQGQLDDVGEIDPLRALTEPLLQQLLAIVRDGAVDPGVITPQLLIEVLSAALEAGTFGPLAINQELAEQLEAAFENSVMIVAVELAHQNGDLPSLQDLQLAGALFGWPGVVTAAAGALQDLLAPPVTLP